jgi:LysM repeat protein
MSESMPERTSSGGNVFTRKIGPLPLWGWMGVMLGVAGLYYIIHSKNKAASQDNNASAGGVNSPGGVDSSLVPQFVNQVYDQSSPPVAPNVTVNKTINSGNTTTTTTNQPTTGTRPPVTTTTTNYITYTVKAGDTLDSIAKKYGITVTELAHAPGNVYVAGEVPGNAKVGQQLGTGAGLKTGMVLHVPQYKTTSVA